LIFVHYYHGLSLWLAHEKGTCVLVTRDINDIQQQLKFLNPKRTVIALPHQGVLPYENTPPNPKISGIRARAFYNLTHHKDFILLVTPEAWLQNFPRLADSVINPIHIKVGDSWDRQLLEVFLKEGNYERKDLVEYPGSFAIRGNLIDIFPTTESHPIRIDYFGDEVESIRRFDALSQKTIHKIDAITLYAAAEWALTEQRKKTFEKRFKAQFNIVDDRLLDQVRQGIRLPGISHLWPLFFEKRQSLPDVLPKKAQCFIARDINLQKTAKQAADLYQQSVALGRLCITPDTLYMSPDRLLPQRLSMDGPYRSHNKKAFAGIDKTVILGVTHPKRVADLLGDQGVKVADKWPEEKGVFSIPFPVKEGFEGDTFILFSEEDILGKTVQRKKKKKLYKKRYSIGDYVVHAVHGIGRFQGLEKVVVNDNEHECIRLEYADNQRLLTPIEHFDLLSLYSQQAEDVRLDHLGTLAWQKRKAATKKRINEICTELLKTAAQRQMIKTDSIDVPHDPYTQFVDGFPYVETDDQSQAISDIFDDLKSAKLMDRMVCGDAGFGKTEVAMRGIFAMVANGYQVAVMTPTTTLCRQHYMEFKTRFKDCHIGQLSRLSSTREQTNIKKALVDGSCSSCSIVVGTTALLSEKIKYNRLGMLVIDEEHHFGVKQKEKIKKLYKNIHFLSYLQLVFCHLLDHHLHHDYAFLIFSLFLHAFLP